MNGANTAPLRVSCERCRAQKLRCVPSSDTDSDPPCQRCVRAKVADSCVFGRRSRTGRCRKPSGNGHSQPRLSRGDNENSMPALPGMGTFALSTTSPSVSSDIETLDPLGSLSTRPTPHVFGLDDSTMAVDGVSEGSVTDCWQDHTKTLDPFSLDTFLQQPSNLFIDANDPTITGSATFYSKDRDLTASRKTSHSVGNGDKADFNGLTFSPADTPQADNSVDVDMSTVERPSPIVELTALLAEMPPYESQLSKLSGGELHNYPIGDALFLSSRFYAILSECSQLSPASAAAQLNTPTMLLALSCFMTLTRIYTLVFGHLYERLSRALEAHSGQGTRKCGHLAVGADVQSYRGLRLSQLQPICLCAGWDPTKKAVSMLLSSLGGAEGWLRLPSDVRIIAVNGADGQEEQTTTWQGVCREKTVLFEEGSMATLTNGRLHKTVRKQAKDLRTQVEEVEELLKGTPDVMDRF